MDELVTQGLTLIEKFGAVAVLFMWLVWLIRFIDTIKKEHAAAIAALKSEQAAEINRLRAERDKSNDNYTDLLTEIKVNRPIRELRYEDDERPTKRLGIDQERLREEWEKRRDAGTD